MAKIAVIQSGAKQYLVKEGDVVAMENISGVTGKGTKVNFDVLMLADGDAVKFGAPHISGAKVAGEIVEEGRSDKVTVIRYRQKSRYFKKKGHRQPYTKVKITSL
ncbi:50S ribosomal protein L21 [Candidatus Kaiserbacteria bacterium RIFCSPHIGHO2_01_FULL_56_24]|uniref:Large ribosomal subunit protein bL21 n=1 Tax=Candidatus Kaiserbacteria bacterium RIFCSPHIGHO2_01_FULL_56_24 TaxID=1798487 RepID=A0A1F6DEY5_9BACT|nr:MAG: 50S ribosomal protein L21 [Candidatus Kaiserbacteria bacterium RIFCSPHIGHO2_01_FULL_56_24]